MIFKLPCFIFFFRTLWSEYKQESPRSNGFTGDTSTEYAASMFIMKLTTNQQEEGRTTSQHYDTGGALYMAWPPPFRIKLAKDINYHFSNYKEMLIIQLYSDYSHTSRILILYMQTSIMYGSQQNQNMVCMLQFAKDYLWID